MDNFSKLLNEALGNGETIESAFRSAVVKAAQEAIDSFMESEMSAYLGYERYDHKNGDNTGDSRNGRVARTIATSLGPITINVPRDRNGGFRSAAVAPYKRKTEIISSAIMKLYSAGMTDDEMRLVIESLYDAKVSKSYVSDVTDAVVEDVKRFNEAKMPSDVFCLYLDSTYLPVRRETVRREAVNIAMAITGEGEKRILGYSITPEESAEAYRDLLASFKARGLKSVAVVVSDGIPGIDGAIDSSYPGAKRQRCFVHLLRNLCSKVRSSDRDEIAGDFMAISKAKSAEDGASLLGGFNDKWGSRYPKVRSWASKVDHVLTFLEFPDELRHLIYTNNLIEGFNKQIKRGLKKQIQFVTEEALEKRLVTMFLHYNNGIDTKKVHGWKTIVDLMGK